MTILVDTSAFIALLDQSQRHHVQASNIWQQLVQRETTVVTTNYILIEMIALLQSRYGMEAVSLFLDKVRPYLEIVWVDQSVHQEGIAALLTANNRKLSLVDCVSFVAMRRSGIETAFAFDSHFVDQGFSCLS